MSVILAKSEEEPCEAFDKYITKCGGCAWFPGIGQVCSWRGLNGKTVTKTSLAKKRCYKPLTAEQMRAYNQSHKEQINEQQRIYRQSHKEAR
jgi:hypothetical protein